MNPSIDVCSYQLRLRYPQFLDARVFQRYIESLVVLRLQHFFRHRFVAGRKRAPNPVAGITAF